MLRQVIHRQTKEAAVSNRKAGEEFAALDAEFTKFKNDPYVKAGLFVKRIVFWLKMLAGGAIIGAIVFGYVKGGAWGAVHTLTLGATWVFKTIVSRVSSIGVGDGSVAKTPPVQP